MCFVEAGDNGMIREYLNEGTYNVALGKTASQSSNYRTSQRLASTAIDGNVGNNAMASGSCFDTKNDYQPWWRVDLHQDYYITSVVLYNRLDQCCGTYNVALGQTASQSSNYRKSRGLAPTAVDGDVGNNDMASGSCFHTNTEYEPWWRVDLHQDYYITSVVMHNRLDCCVTHSKITKRIFDASNDEGGIISELTDSTPIVHIRMMKTAIFKMTRMNAYGEKSEETSRNPDAQADTVPSARDLEMYTEIGNAENKNKLLLIKQGEISDRQGNCRRTGESSFTVQTNDLLHYREFGARVSEPYTELDNPIYENIRK
ncbi:FUCL-like protein [Mya arenaria]|uniref:FUCL-like protein n=1 Tax=Mya arenaria TaxID=6604 RepID=A0ABY7EBH2_MYAAR|nr:FUCL-like protein [Mya arenaria]